MTGGVTYNFKMGYDDNATVKIAGKWVRPYSPEDTAAICSFKPSATGWYKIEFRVGNNGGPGGAYSARYYGILWKTADDTTWRKVMDFGDGRLFKTGREDLKYIPSTIYPYDPYGHFLYIYSAEMRPGDKTIMDISYADLSTKTNVDVRALAFQDGERSFWKVIRPKTFVADREGQETAGEHR